MSGTELISEENYDWLTETLFEPIIEKELSDCVRSDYELKLTSIKPAVGKGDNYVSLVTRVELDVNFVNGLGFCCRSNRKPITYNFIVKSSITLMKEFEEMDIFEKEIEFYDGIAENFRKFDNTITFMPKYYSTTKQDRTIMIMNDLGAVGFKMQDRLVGLDLDHCKIYFKTIAQFHALGAAHYEKFGRYAERFHQSFYRLELKPMFDKWNEVLLSEFFSIFDRYESLKPYREKIRLWKEGGFEAVCEIVRENSDGFNVLNHGDSWVNNMLFRHDADNKPIELCLVDFQIAVYGTPMTDILYFFVSSPTVEVREHHFDELLFIYHTNLVKYLIKYNYPKPIPTMRELQIMMLNQGLLGAFLLNGITPLVLLDAEDTKPADFFVKEGEEGDRFRYKLYNCPRYIKTLEVALKFFDQRGLFEV